MHVQTPEDLHRGTLHLRPFMELNLIDIELTSVPFL
jgi:hypothetical protein